MIRLFIDGSEVNLQPDVSIDYYMYNPFFDRKGEFTYDIDIDLKDANNARVYQHINRWNKKGKPVSRSAELWSDNKCLMRGTEIILEVNNNIAKIQIVTGNGELNYLVAHSDLCIQDLDLGSCDLNVNTAKESLFHSGSDWDFVCTPIARVQRQFAVGWYVDEDIAAGKFYNNLLRPGYNEGASAGRNDYEVNFASRPNLRAQPYLAAMVEKVVKALGYNVAYNHLRVDQVFSKVYIVNATETTEYKHMMPNWKVNDFISEVEKWCNVVFVVNQQNKSCRIIPASEFYASAGDVVIDKEKVKDEFERRFEEKVSENISYRNLKYDLPDSTWHRYADIGSTKMQQFWVTTEQNHSIEESLNNKIIVKYENEDCEFVGRIWDTKSASGEDRHIGYWMPCNFLKELRIDNSEEITKFKIVPAEVIGLSLYGRYWTGDGNRNISTPGVTCIPYATSQGNSDKEGDGYAATSLIEGSEKEVAINPSAIPVACYNGMWRLSYQQWFADQNPYICENLKFPLSTVTNVTAARTATDGANLNIIFYDENDLRLKSLYNRVYKKNYNVDTTVIHKASFFTEELLDTKQYYIIANRKMYCRCLHYKIDSGGLKEEVEGEFFST